MNILKNMEIIFVASAVLLSAATYATASVPTFHAGKNAHLSSVVANAKMQVIVIKGKRLSAAEKASLS